MRVPTKMMLRLCRHSDGYAMPARRCLLRARHAAMLILFMMLDYYFADTRLPRSGK